MRHLRCFGDLRDFKLLCASGIGSKRGGAKLSFEPFYSHLHIHIDLFDYAGMDNFGGVGLFSCCLEDQKTEVDLMV